MKNYAEKLRKFIQDNNIQGQHLSFTQSCHSVAQAAQAANANQQDFVKNICLIDNRDNLIVAIVMGEDRVSTSRIAEILNIEPPRTATPPEILKKTGYPCGGVPSFGYQATFLIDQRVMEMDTAYTGGGSENSLVKISAKELQRANQGKITTIRK